MITITPKYNINLNFLLLLLLICVILQHQTLHVSFILLHLCHGWLLEVLVPRLKQLFTIHETKSILTIIMKVKQQDRVVALVSLFKQTCFLHSSHLIKVISPHHWQAALPTLFMLVICSFNKSKSPVHSRLFFPRGCLTSRYCAYDTRSVLSLHWTREGLSPLSLNFLLM